jgi:hypothetical protein
LSEANTPRLTDVVGLFRDIAFLRRGPEDLPASQSLLVSTVIAFALISLAMAWALPSKSPHEVAQLAVGTGLMLAWGWAVLKLAGRPERFVQTMTAIFGFHLLLAPAAIVGAWLFNTYQADPTWKTPVLLFAFLLGLWELVVIGRILRNATQWPVFVCICLIISQALLTQIIVLSLFPELKPTP